MAYLYLVRHGETLMNAENRFNGGGVDSPLTAKGRAGAVALGKMLANVHFDRVFVSPLPRAMATAQLVVGSQTVLTIDSRLREMSLGDWDGTPLADWYGKPQFINYRRHLEHWDYAHFHAESYQHLVARATAAFDAAAAAVGPNGRALIVSHGIVLTVLANVLTGVPLNDARNSGQVANSSVTVLKGQAGSWQKVAWNVTPASLPELDAKTRVLFQK